MDNLIHLLDVEFFKVLTLSDRTFNMEMLLYLYENINDLADEGRNDRKNIVDLIERKLDSLLDTDQYYVSTEEREKLKSNRDKANYTLNKFIKHKWLFEESLADATVTLNFYGHSRQILRTLKSIKDDEQAQFSGNITLIYNTIRRFDFDDREAFERVLKLTEELTENLEILRSNLYMYYSKHLEEKSKTELQQLLIYFTDFKSRIFDKNFYELQTKESVKRYQGTIIEKIREILNQKENIEKLASHFVGDDLPYKLNNLLEAVDYVENKFYVMLNSFQNIGKLNDAIEEKSNQYVSVLMSRLNYLIRRDDDIVGKINKLFDLIYTKSDDDIIDYPGLLDTRLFYDGSLAKPRKVQEKIIPSELPFEDIRVSEEAKQKTLEELEALAKYGLDAVNKYVDDYLVGRDSFQASEIMIDEYEDYIFIILIYIHSVNKEATYHVEMLDEMINRRGLKFNNFRIVRKKHE